MAGNSWAANTTRGSGFVVGDGSWVVTAGHVVSVALGRGRRLADRTAWVYSPWTGGPVEAQVEAVSLGEEKPRCNDSTEECFARNRRGDLLHAGEF